MPDEKHEVVKYLIDKFRIERYIYLSFMIVCLIILLSGVAALLLGFGDQRISGGVSVASFGTIFALIGRVLKMYDRAMDAIDHKPERT